MSNKSEHILTIYSKFLAREIVNKKDMAELFNVHEKTIERCIADIKDYYTNKDENIGKEIIVYSKKLNGYCFTNPEEDINKKDILAIVKILLESRAFCKEELNHLIEIILKKVPDNERKAIDKIIRNERYNYVSLKHNSNLIDKIWGLSELIRKQSIAKIFYRNMANKEVTRTIKPVSIIFSEYYFYLIAYFEKYDSPTIFRIDRIQEYDETGEKFKLSNSKRFEDGEFRKRIQFMYSGSLEKIRFEFWGSSLEAVLDRIPTARVLRKEEDKYIIEAEVYGTGIMMWILSQGSKIKVTYPKEFAQKIASEVKKINDLYK